MHASEIGIPVCLGVVTLVSGPFYPLLSKLHSTPRYKKVKLSASSTLTSGTNVINLILRTYSSGKYIINNQNRSCLGVEWSILAGTGHPNTLKNGQKPRKNLRIPAKFSDFCKFHRFFKFVYILSCGILNVSGFLSWVFGSS
jgi:hypothetical protein